MGPLLSGDSALEATKAAIADKSKRERGGVNWLGRKCGSGAYRLDLLLLDGFDDSKSGAPRGGLRGHIDSLRKLGIEVIRDAKGLWRITGNPHSKSVGQSVERKRNPITPQQYRLGYELGRDVFMGKVSKPNAIVEQVRIGTNETSAGNLIYIVDALLTGKVFKRTLKDEAHGYYLDWILRDFGTDRAKLAIKATHLHLAYDKEHGAERWMLRAIVKRFEGILNGESPGPSSNAGAADDSDARKNKGPNVRQALVKLRYGQPEFRKKLLTAYFGRCAGEQKGSGRNGAKLGERQRDEKQWPVE